MTALNTTDDFDLTQPDLGRKRPQLSGAELRELRTFRDDLPLFHFLISIALVVAAPVILHFYPNVWGGIACVLLNIHTFNRVANIVHGSDHAGLFLTKKWNEPVGKVSGWFLGYLQHGHKNTHDSHHRYLNTELDDDRIWCEPEAKISSLLHGWGRDLLLLSAFQRFLQYIPKRSRKSATAADGATNKEAASYLHFIRLFAPIAALQLGILLLYHVLAGFQFYFLVYILPLFIIYPAQIRLRSAVEHSFPVGYVCKSPEDYRIIRSVKANWAERFLIAPLRGEYHFEHHILPSMPYYNAPKLRRMLEEKGFHVPSAEGYLAFVWNKWRAERAAEVMQRVSN